MGMQDFIVVIPSRFASTRLPGKPLREIAGEPMVAHVWRRALGSAAARVVVATDDERIRTAFDGLDAEVVMTRDDHPRAPIGWPRWPSGWRCPTMPSWSMSRATNP